MRPAEMLAVKQMFLDSMRYVHDRTREEWPNEFSRLLERLLIHAPRWENYLVTGDMTEVCLHAATQLPRHPPHHDGLVPSRNGFAVFAKPTGTWANDDMEEHDVVGLCWAPWWDLSHDPESPDHLIAVTPLLRPLTKTEPDRVILGEIFCWPVDDPLSGYEPTVTYSRVPIAALTYSMWALMGDSIVTSQREQVDRATRRRMERQDIVSDVVVYHLRRRHVTQNEETAVGAMGRDYSHRFLVSGHWRNQYHPSDASHRLRWISPYVKGPEDKELVLKDRVIVLDR